LLEYINILDYNVICYTTPPKLEGIIDEKYVKQDGLDVSSKDVISAIILSQHIQKCWRDPEMTCKKILTYHSSVNNALNFKKTLNYILDKYKMKVNVFVISGRDSLRKRDEIFEEFRNVGRVSIICSAKVLNEGVNLPHVDTVMFVDPRGSTIDVTQCLGRGMRLYKKLKKCNVIIPIHYDEVTGKHNYSNIIKILTAMSDIDDKIIEYFIDKKKRKSSKLKIMKMDIEVDWNYDMNEVEYTIKDVIKGLKSKVLGSIKLLWEYKRSLLFEYCDIFEQIPTGNTSYRGYNMGRWFTNIKRELNSVCHVYYDKLSKNCYVKKNLDNKIFNLEWKTFLKSLFEYCDKYI
jgi:predicted helicase